MVLHTLSGWMKNAGNWKKQKHPIDDAFECKTSLAVWHSIEATSHQTCPNCPKNALSCMQHAQWHNANLNGTAVWIESVGIVLWHDKTVNIIVMEQSRLCASENGKSLFSVCGSRTECFQLMLGFWVMRGNLPAGLARCDSIICDINLSSSWSSWLSFRQLSNEKMPKFQPLSAMHQFNGNKFSCCAPFGRFHVMPLHPALCEKYWQTVISLSILPHSMFDRRIWHPESWHSLFGSNLFAMENESNAWIFSWLEISIIYNYIINTFASKKRKRNNSFDKINSTLSPSFI